jgi:hypothetical protein
VWTETFFLDHHTKLELQYIKNNIDLPLDGENLWANCKYKKFSKLVSFQITVIISNYLKILLL